MRVHQFMSISAVPGPTDEHVAQTQVLKQHNIWDTNIEELVHIELRLLILWATHDVICCFCFDIYQSMS